MRPQAKESRAHGVASVGRGAHSRGAVWSAAASEGTACARGRRFVGRRFAHRRRHLGRPLDARQCRAEDVVWRRQTNAALETMKMNFEVEKEYSDRA